MSLRFSLFLLIIMLACTSKKARHETSDSPNATHSPVYLDESHEAFEVQKLILKLSYSFQESSLSLTEDSIKIKELFAEQKFKLILRCEEETLSLGNNYSVKQMLALGLHYKGLPSESDYAECPMEFLTSAGILIMKRSTASVEAPPGFEHTDKLKEILQKYGLQVVLKLIPEVYDGRIINSLQKNTLPAAKFVPDVELVLSCNNTTYIAKLELGQLYNPEENHFLDYSENGEKKKSQDTCILEVQSKHYKLTLFKTVIKEFSESQVMAARLKPTQELISILDKHTPEFFIKAIVENPSLQEFIDRKMAVGEDIMGLRNIDCTSTTHSGYPWRIDSFELFSPLEELFSQEGEAIAGIKVYAAEQGSGMRLNLGDRFEGTRLAWPPSARYCELYLSLDKNYGAITYGFGSSPKETHDVLKLTFGENAVLE